MVILEHHDNHLWGLPQNLKALFHRLQSSVNMFCLLPVNKLHISLQRGYNSKRGRWKRRRRRMPWRTRGSLSCCRSREPAARSAPPWTLTWSPSSSLLPTCCCCPPSPSARCSLSWTSPPSAGQTGRSDQMRNLWRENSFSELQVKLSGEQVKLCGGIEVIGRQGRGGGSCEQLLGSVGIVEDAAAGIPRRRRQGCWCLAAPNLPEELPHCPGWGVGRVGTRGSVLVLYLVRWLPVPMGWLLLMRLLYCCCWR